MPGLDDILGGGLPRNQLYLIQGQPGVGKTTLALQYLLEGVRQGETGFYVTLSETKEELRAVAESHGWSLDGIELFELEAVEQSLKPEAQYTLFHPSEVELGETVERVTAAIERVEPVRVVLDSLSELRLLARDPLRFRRQILALKQFFIGRQCTVLLLDDGSAETGEIQLESLAHGVIVLEQKARGYGSDRRSIRITKVRGVAFRTGHHDMTLEQGGLCVYPRLVAAEHHRAFSPERASSGIEELDALLSEGLDRGSSTLLVGPAGAGKSTIASQFAVAAAERGEKAAIFTFEEGLAALFARSEGLGMTLREHTERGTIRCRQIDPAELSPGQLAHAVRQAVEEYGARVVVIDSLNGYLRATPGEAFLVLQLHELLSYLNHMGVVTVLTLAQHGFLGIAMKSDADVSYLADSVILLRYFEAAGRLRKAISVMKRRSGGHETTIRELSMSANGVRVGEPLTDFQGVLTGVPAFHGSTGPSGPLLGDLDA
jgi:circadian clock protein KaiC